jgi:hypothetical protein
MVMTFKRHEQTDSHINLLVCPAMMDWLKKTALPMPDSVAL